MRTFKFLKPSRSRLPRLPGLPGLPIVIILLVFAMISPAQDDKSVERKKPKIRKFNITVPYAFREEMLLISDADLNCHPFVRKDQSADIIITGSETMDSGKYDYSEPDRMFINKGSNDGIEEDDALMVIGKGEKIRNPFTGKSLGYYYQKKSRATIYCLYEDKAIITLNKTCYPVQIGDIVLPYKSEEPIFEKRLKYTKCRLPVDRAVDANVVLTPQFTYTQRYVSGNGDYVIVDAGRGLVNYGDWMLLYRLHKKHLPPVITGVGMIVDVQNLSATLKIIDCAFPIVVGSRAVLMEVEDDGETGAVQQTMTDPEDVPTVAMDAPQALDFNILFDINKSIVTEAHKQELVKVAEYIKDKTEIIIILRGYSCSIGGLEYNLKLSKQRVDNVKKYIMDTFNIQANIIETHHYGEKDAPFDNSSEEQRRKNRLVNIEVRAK